MRSDSNVHKFLNEILEDNRAVGSSHPSQRHISVDLTSVSLLVDGSVEEKLQTTKLIDSAFKEKTLDRNLEKYWELITSNRKRKAVDMDSDTSAIIASKDICSPIADSVPSSPFGCERNNLVETSGSCYKRQRWLFIQNALTVSTFSIGGSSLCYKYYMMPITISSLCTCFCYFYI